MSQDEAPRHAGRPERIRTPDQLQQARRPDRPEPREEAGTPGEGGEPPRRAGVLGQLETERAHD